MTLYEVNKMAYCKMPNMSQEDFIRASIKTRSMNRSAKYYMLLCREKYDFTVFEIVDHEDGFNKLWNTSLDIMEERGYDMKDIVTREDGNLEYWIYDKITGECYMYLLFPYDWGVIKL